MGLAQRVAGERTAQAVAIYYKACVEALYDAIGSAQFA